MGKFIECLLLMVAGACAGALAIMLAVMTLPTVLDQSVQYIMAVMFAVSSVIALLQFAKQWNSLFK